jgi:hypothetical protein
MFRWQLNWPNHQQLNFVQLQDFRLQNKWDLAAISRKKISEALPEEEPSENGVVGKKKTTRTGTKRTTSRTRKKKVADALEKNSEVVGTHDPTNEKSVVSEDPKKTRRRTRRKGTTLL